MVNRRAQIIYEYTDGSIRPDDIEDELPFDLKAPVIELRDEDFGIWYLDAMENPDKYRGKHIHFKAYVCQTKRAPKGCFVAGRFGMTCCAEDISFIGVLCEADNAAQLRHRSWVDVTAELDVKRHEIYGGEGPWQRQQPQPDLPQSCPQAQLVTKLVFIQGKGIPQLFQQSGLVRVRRVQRQQFQGRVCCNGGKVFLFNAAAHAAAQQGRFKQVDP